MESHIPEEDDISPKPLPYIINNYSNLTTKKEKYSVTPKVRKVPPPAPYKSISKVSRLSYSLNNTQGSTQKARIISFKQENQSQLSKLYNETIQESYFKQCFIIEEKIGSGSFGDVFKVKSREDGKYYAVKVSRERFKGKGDREERLNEVRKHEQLPSHDHLVKLFRAWEEKQRLYIQTELCSISLSALAEKNHNISEDTIWRYLVDLLKAIDHLHSNDLIHLDIKPENIFISQDSKCKLGDFGLVFDVNNRDLVEATEGDPKYLASEVIQNIYTKAADIFSLGMTILELASDLDLPSQGPDWHKLRTAGEIPDKIFQNMSSDLKSIILLMIHPEYQLRPSAKELLNHPIVRKFEEKRRFELQIRKYLSLLYSLKSAFLNLLSRVSLYLNALAVPVINRMTGIFPAITKKEEDDSSEANASPMNQSRASPNFNRAYVSNYLDEYSDDDVSEIRPMNNLSSDSSFSNEEEMFRENLSSRNLCSTVARNNCNPAIPRLSPFFTSNNHTVDTNAISMDTIKSVTQRLTFDDISSDELEMAENDEDDQLAPMQSSLLSSVASAADEVSTSQYRFRNNISRKNLAKTFDELDAESANT